MKGTVTILVLIAAVTAVLCRLTEVSANTSRSGMMGRRRLQADDDFVPIEEPVPLAGITIYNDTDDGSEVPAAVVIDVTEDLEEDEQVTGERHGHRRRWAESSVLRPNHVSFIC